MIPAELLSEEPEELVDPNTLKPDLYIAAKDDDTEVVLGYLSEKVPCTYIDDSGWTPLHWAAKNGNATMLRALMDNKATGPYHRVKQMQNPDYKKAITMQEEPEAVKDITSMEALKETFELMQKRREDEEMTDFSTDLLRNTPLLWAAFKGHLFIVWMLLCDNYSPNDMDDMGNTALHLAAAAGHVKVVEVLIRDGVNCNKVNIYKNLPIDTTTDPKIRDILVTAMTKGASMTPKEAAQKHESNIKWVFK